MVDTVTIPASGNGPTLEEQDAAQTAAEAAAANNTPPLAGEEGNTDERPEWLPEKFKTVEDMAAAYAELERAQSQGSEEPEGNDETAEQAVNEAGLDMDALSAEWDTNGELSDDSYEALEAVGISRDMVDMYVAGLEATTQATTADLLEGLDGGQEAYNEMVNWAADNLPEGKIDSFNTVLETGNPDAIKLAVANLQSQFVDANGFEPSNSLAGNSSAGGIGTYESTAQLMADMGNPAYANDPAFRAKVEAKLARSNIL